MSARPEQALGWVGDPTALNSEAPLAAYGPDA